MIARFHDRGSEMLRLTSSVSPLQHTGLTGHSFRQSGLVCRLQWVSGQSLPQRYGVTRWKITQTAELFGSYNTLYLLTRIEADACSSIPEWQQLKDRFPSVGCRSDRASARSSPCDGQWHESLHQLQKTRLLRDSHAPSSITKRLWLTCLALFVVGYYGTSGVHITGSRLILLLSNIVTIAAQSALSSIDLVLDLKYYRRLLFYCYGFTEQNAGNSWSVTCRPPQFSPLSSLFRGVSKPALQAVDLAGGFKRNPWPCSSRLLSSETQWSLNFWNQDFYGIFTLLSVGTQVS